LQLSNHTETEVAAGLKGGRETAACTITNVSKLLMGLLCQ
jgi:hypothetical protein